MSNEVLTEHLLRCNNELQALQLELNELLSKTNDDGCISQEDEQKVDYLLTGISRLTKEYESLIDGIN